ncbi:MAG: B12-binding domain-containing radical SAM protein, partial [Mariprofundaceae bacterium]|nr:B12-binding domain-containing radical SAM protein [Mariprofundaceae bacterium]
RVLFRSIWIYQQTQSTWKIALERLAKLLFDYLTQEKNVPKIQLAEALSDDLMKLEGRVLPNFLRPFVAYVPKVKQKKISGHSKRQQRHVL